MTLGSVRVIHMMRLAEKVARNFVDLKLWGRNAKVLVITELLFGIPMSWVFFYQIIFMRSLGVSEVFIGFTVMLSLVFHAFLPVLGGYLADKFGRKRSFMMFDSVGWVGSMVAWFLAREPWHMILAVVFQGLSTTTYGVWETLLVEDTETPYRVSIYSFIQLIYIFGGTLTPIAGALVSLYGVEQGCRYMFLIGIIAIVVMLGIRQIYLVESRIGEALSSSGRGGTTGSKGYMEVFKTIAGHRKLLILFVLSITGSLQYYLVSTYKPLYLSGLEGLALDESIVSVIPMASSIPSLIVLFFIVPKLKQAHIGRALLLSYVCSILGIITLITAPRGSLILAVLSAILDSARPIAVFSILRVFFVNTIDEVNPFARAKIMSLITMFSALVSWPGPLVGGYLYAASPALPFVLAAVFLVLSIGLMLRI